MSAATGTYERTWPRYARAGYKIVTIEVLDDDPCVGHPCHECGHPFQPGEHIQGDHLRHEKCPR